MRLSQTVTNGSPQGAAAFQRHLREGPDAKGVHLPARARPAFGIAAALSALALPYFLAADRFVRRGGAVV